MIVAYLVNQYPKVSHTFIRREIKAVEARGVRVRRFSIRPCYDRLPDAADEAEKAQTTALLDRGPRGLLAPTLRLALTKPRRFARACGAAWRMGRRSDRGVLRHGVYLMEACRLLRELQRCGAEHLHVHFGTNGAAVALLCRTLGGPPFSMTVHGPEEFDKPESLSLGEKAAHASFVAAISEHGRSQLFRWCEFEHWPKLRVIRCGLDASFLQAPESPVPERPRLVCVGRLCEAKGQLRLIEAAHRLAQEGVPFELVLVGDGPMRSAVEAAIDRRGLRDRVSITGYVSGDRVREEILRSRALVLPSFAEGLPVVMMEALALGRPVISTFIAGIPELITPGETGWLVPAGSVDELTRAMRDALAADPSALEAKGRNGRRRVAELHDIDTQAERLIRLFRGETTGPQQAPRRPAHESSARQSQIGVTSPV